MVPNVGRFTCGWHVVCLAAARLAEGEAHIGRASGDEPSRRTGERVTMESTRIRAPFDRAGDNDERREEREHVGMGDSSGTLVAVWLRFRVACRRTPIC